MYEAFWGKNVPSFEEYLANLQYMYISGADYLAAESFPSGKLLGRFISPSIPRCKLLDHECTMILVWLLQVALHFTQSFSPHFCFTSWHPHCISLNVGRYISGWELVAFLVVGWIFWKPFQAPYNITSKYWMMHLCCWFFCQVKLLPLFLIQTKDLCPWSSQC